MSKALRVSAIVLYLSIFMALIVIWMASHWYTPTLSIAEQNCLRELTVGQNSLIYVCHTGYETTRSRSKILISKAESRQELEAFVRSTPWWHDDNSWWEGVGWAVDERRRFVGFEVAKGEFSPPFAWRQPKLSFSLAQIPMLFATLVIATPGIVWSLWIIKKRRTVWLTS